MRGAQVAPSFNVDSIDTDILMRNRLWMRAVLATALATSAGLTLAVAQQPTDQTPTLPDTEVEAAPPTLPPTNVEGTPPPTGAADDALDAFDPYTNGFLLRSPAVEGYRAPSSTTATLIDLPDALIPATVNTIPRDLLNDQQALRFQDVVRNAGATVQSGDNLFADKIFIRGLELNSRDFRKNGFQDSTYTPRDFQNVERVEILKGPPSVLYGANNASGMVNLITKKPVADQFTNFGYTFGSFQQERFTLDQNGYGTSDGSVLYRINAAYENQDTFRDFGKLERTLIAPVATWFINDTTFITWEGEFHRDDRRGDRGIPAISGNALALPPQRFVGEPANDFIHYEDYRQQLTLVSELSDVWTFSIGAQSLFYEFPGSSTTPAAQVGPTQFARTRSSFEDQEHNQSLIANLAGDGDILGMNHKMLFGTEQLYYDSDAKFTTLSLAGGGIIDAANPVYTNPAATPVFVFDAPVFRQNRSGFYVQDYVSPNDYVHFLGGARFDRLELKYVRNLGFGPITNEDTFDSVTPRGGVVINPFADDTLAIYYNYSRSFSPPGGGAFNLTGAPMRPELGELNEFGIKTLLLDNLTLNAAGFYTTRENASFTTAFTTFQFGRERSQGAEVNLLGQITEQWSATANYAYTDTELTDPNNAAFFGQRQRNVPLNSANLWTRYNFVQQQEQTMGAALGIVYLDERPGNLANTVVLPAFSRWDAGLFYSRGRLNASLYVENIFDVAYAANSVDQFQIFPGAPANARAQISILY
jgi:iron complex outermembrane receptor protein